MNGNSYASLRAGAGPGLAPLMLAGHIDEIGLVVVHIDRHLLRPSRAWRPRRHHP